MLGRIVVGFVIASHGLVGGCGVSRRTFDKPPERGWLDDRWSGHYFDRVDAAYSLPLYSTSPSLWKNFQSPLKIVSNRPDAPKSLAGTAKTAPVSAGVEIHYQANHAEGVAPSEIVGAGEMTVTLYWPNDHAGPISERNTVSESKTIPIGDETVADLLEASDRFRVDEENHFVGRPSEPIDFTNSQEAVPVQISIAGKNPAAAYQGSVDYHDKLHLYRLVDRVWPGTN